MHKMPETNGQSIPQINGPKDLRNAVKNRKDEDLQIKEGWAFGNEKGIRSKTSIFL